MPVRRRIDKRRSELSEDAQLWLRGEPVPGFFRFKPEAEMRDIWERYGDKTVMEWPEGERGPCKIETQSQIEG